MRMYVVEPWPIGAGLFAPCSGARSPSAIATYKGKPRLTWSMPTKNMGIFSDAALAERTAGGESGLLLLLGGQMACGTTVPT